VAAQRGKHVSVFAPCHVRRFTAVPTAAAAAAADGLTNDGASDGMLSRVDLSNVVTVSLTLCAQWAQLHRSERLYWKRWEHASTIGWGGRSNNSSHFDRPKRHWLRSRLRSSAPIKYEQDAIQLDCVSCSDERIWHGTTHTAQSPHHLNVTRGLLLPGPYRRRLGDIMCRTDREGQSRGQLTGCTGDGNDSGKLCDTDGSTHRDPGARMGSGGSLIYDANTR